MLLKSAYKIYGWMLSGFGVAANCCHRSDHESGEQNLCARTFNALTREVVSEFKQIDMLTVYSYARNLSMITIYIRPGKKIRPEETDKLLVKYE